MMRLEKSAGTHQPLLGDEDDDELLGHQRQAQHQGKGDEGGEAQQLAQYGLLAVAVFLYLGEHGLGDAVDDVRDER